MNKKRVVTATVIALVCFVAFYLAITYRFEGPAEPGQGGQVSENVQDLITEAIATEKGVVKENVKICFYEQTTDNDIYAAGAVIRGGGALAVFYDKILRQITQTENEYFPATNEEFQALSIVVGTISPWTGNEIVPADFTKADNTYSFKYYDGYLSALSRWSYGWATLYLDNETIEWGSHVE